jgi:hypothetical protein
LRSDMLIWHEFLGGRREARLPGPNMATRSRHPSLQERIDQFKAEMSQAARAPAVSGNIQSSRDPPSRLQRFSLPGTGLEGSPLPRASGLPPSVEPRAPDHGQWDGGVDHPSEQRALPSPAFRAGGLGSAIGDAERIVREQRERIAELEAESSTRAARIRALSAENTQQAAHIATLERKQGGDTSRGSAGGRDGQEAARAQALRLDAIERNVSAAEARVAECERSIEVRPHCPGSRGCC